MNQRKVSDLNREILRLSVPSILANVTVPLVGMVDTAIAGHIVAADGFSQAAYIGSISVGAMMLNLLYWMAGFLRTGTGGLVAQAFGREDYKDCGRCLLRALTLALSLSLVFLLIQHPFGRFALLLTSSSEEVGELAFRYFLLRIWAAPATLSLMAFRGFFVGMQDSVSSMFTDLIINVVNIVSSLVLSLGVGSWDGLGFDGIALGTVIAQFSGLIFAVCVTAVKYRDAAFKGVGLKESMAMQGARSYLSLNADFFIRSICFTVIYMGEVMIAARFGDEYLASNAILMNLLMVFSYFTDGFAYAGEALTGRFIGARDVEMTRRSIRYVFVWSMGLAVLFVAVYAIGGLPVLRLMTGDETVLTCCAQYLPWPMLMPLVGCAAFAWDGIYMGATASRGIRNSMILAMFSFLGVWYGGSALFHPQGAMCLHLLMAAYFAHLLVRTVMMSLDYKRSILGRL